MHEFDLIARIRARAALRGDVVLGIGDDCALLAPPAGMQLAVTMDTLNVGVHFPADTVPYDIGWKALAVNLSDLAAMGAQPAWCTLSLSLPGADAVFLDGFTDGFLTLAKQHDFALIGGDTTRGPLSISVTAHGLVAPGSALRRTGAQVGDDVWVSGTLGDAAGALRQWQQGDAMTPVLRERLDRPIPRVDRYFRWPAGRPCAYLQFQRRGCADQCGCATRQCGIAGGVRCGHVPCAASQRWRRLRAVLYRATSAAGYASCAVADAEFAAHPHR